MDIDGSTKKTLKNYLILIFKNKTTMTAKTTYTCNLCWDEKQKEDLFCLFWNGTLKTETGFGAYEFTGNTSATDKHICKECVDLIKKLL